LPLFGLGAFAANQLFDVPKLKEIGPKFEKLQKEIKKEKRSPVGILFSSSK
jgi:hypothetical protein